MNSESELLNFLNDTVSNQIPIGTYNMDGTVYKVGDKYLNVVISNNGFIVTAHPITSLADIAKIFFN